MFIGRNDELQQLEDKYNSSKSEQVVKQGFLKKYREKGWRYGWGLLLSDFV